MVVQFDRQKLQDALLAVAQRDEAALREVYRATAAKLFGICLRVLHDEAEAEDVLQDVYVTVWNKAGTYDPARASPVTWLATIARNRAIDRLRSAAVRPGRTARPLDDALQVADPAISAEAVLSRDEDHQRLKGCLEGLDPRHAGLIRQAFFGGLSYSDLAEAAGRPLGTVKTWIRRGLMTLKVCLES